MKIIPMLSALIISGIVIVLALDLGRFAYAYPDVSGHKLRMLITGHGSPTVVFEAGGTGATGGPIENWGLVQPAVSRFTRAVSYDRAGIGLSPAGPKPRDARQIALELHTALQAAHVPPPYLLVGHSFGGPLLRVFAGMYPDEVAGMVLADPTQEEFIDWNLQHGPDHEHHHDNSEEWREIQASLAEAHASRIPPGVPIVVITAIGPRVYPAFVNEKSKADMKILKPMWLKFHNEWVAKQSNATHIITENSGHAIPFEEPELLIKTIREMVESQAVKSSSVISPQKQKPVPGPG